MKIDVIIPAYNEEQSVGKVIQCIPKPPVDTVIVVNNASSDRTAAIARQQGARVVDEPVRGYGQACLRGIREADGADIVVFLDADFSDSPEEMTALIEPIVTGEADLVIGSRTRGEREPGALPPHARFGNLLACFLIRHLFGERFTDLGPFRAIRKTSLDALGMRDADYGWTVEMQTRAAMMGLRCREVPVSYRKRIGQSKISGTFSGSVRAGTKILWTIARVALEGRRMRKPGHSD